MLIPFHVPLSVLEIALYIEVSSLSDPSPQPQLPTHSRTHTPLQEKVQLHRQYKIAIVHYIFLSPSLMAIHCCSIKLDAFSDGIFSHSSWSWN